MTPEDPIGGRHNWSRALILGIDCHDIAIVGAGIIDGGKVHDPAGEEQMRGPHTILLRTCSRTVIRDVTIIDSANYAVLYQGGDDASVRNVVIEGGWDGVHWRPFHGHQGRHLAITNCRMHTGDDCVAGADWSDLIMTDCVLNSSCNAIRLIGPASRVLISGCLMYGPGKHPHRTSNNCRSLAALCLQPGGWGPMPGYFGDIQITRCSLRDIGVRTHGAQTAFGICSRAGRDVPRVIDNVTVCAARIARGADLAPIAVALAPKCGAPARIEGCGMAIALLQVTPETGIC